MRIGLIIYGSLDTVSGGFYYDRKLVEALERVGHSVEVVSLPWRSYTRHLTDNFDRKLLDRLNGADFDLLLQDELNHPSLFWLNRRLKSNVSYPIISIVHHLRVMERHPATYMPLYRFVERRYLQTCDGFLVNSQTTLQTISQLMGHGPSRSHIAFPAGDRFAGLSNQEIEARLETLPDRPFKILFVGNLDPRKGAHVLLQGLGMAQWDHVEVDLVGSETLNRPYVRKLKELVTKYGLENTVRFCGRLVNDALEEKYRSADILVVPSQYEGFGIVYLEGMAFGLPAFGTTGGAAKEIITDDVTGYVIGPEYAGLLIEKIGETMSNVAHLRRMSLAARQRFESHPTWDESMMGAVRFLENQVN